jgi:UDP-2,4-diacetamido-2,4,6-trideoxy-beta-L-altropyranose hydrolase
MTEILFVCDAGARVGGGHVMRSLTLAGELARRGLTPVFAATAEVASVLDRFDANRFARRRPGEAIGDAAAVVFDHYGLSAADHRTLAEGRPALVIDDLADRPLGADLLLDPSPERSPEHYAGKLASGTPLLLGPAYALVRPAFAAGREAALARRARSPEGPLRVLVSLGLTDVGGITGQVAARLQPRLRDARLTLVLGSGAPSLEPMRRLAERDPRVDVVVDTADMARLVAEADLVVGAGGSSTWERAVLGAPTLLVVLADNQDSAARALESQGAVERADARAPDFEAALDRAFTGLLASPDRRARLARTSAALCDGQGAARVADAVGKMVA